MKVSLQSAIAKAAAPIQLTSVNTVASFIVSTSFAGQASAGHATSLNFSNASRFASPTKRRTDISAVCISDRDDVILMTATEQFDGDVEILLERQIASIEHMAVEEVRFAGSAAFLRLFDQPIDCIPAS